MKDDPSDPTAEPVDLSALQARAEPAHMDALIARIAADGMAARADAFARGDGVAVQLTRWARPALAAATLVLAVSIPVAIQSGRELARRAGIGGASGAASMTPVVDERLGLPAPVVDLAQRGRSPTVGDIVAAFDSHWDGR